MNHIDTCPICKKGKIVEATNGYGCNHFVSLDDRCNFLIFKSYFNKIISPEIVSILIKNGETPIYSDFVNKNNKPFNAKLIIDGNHVKVVFENKCLNSPCPCCSAKVTITSNAFICENYFNKECNLYIAKNIAGHSLNELQADKLISERKTTFIDDFTNSNGDSFSARLILHEELNDDKPLFTVKFDFEVAKCPKCKSGLIKSHDKFFGCSNYKDPIIKCDFLIWKQISGKSILSSDVEKLISEGSLPALNGFKTKEGKDYTGKLVLTNEFKVKII